MIRKSGNRFSEKIMLRDVFTHNSSGPLDPWMEQAAARAIADAERRAVSKVPIR
jgi:hypothetical protein